MNLFQSLIASYIILIFSSVGFFFLIYNLYKRIKELDRPRVKPFVNPERMKLLIDTIPMLSLEERFVLIKTLMGTSNIACHIGGDGISISGVGKVPSEDDTERSIDYAY